jgi:hypothetical protein
MATQTNPAVTQAAPASNVLRCRRCTSVIGVRMGGLLEFRIKGHEVRVLNAQSVVRRCGRCGEYNDLAT